MKVEMKQKGGLAINPRTTVFFDKGEILGVGDKGLSEENLNRLVEIGSAKEVDGDAQPEAEEVEPEAEEPEYKSFTKKADLKAHAKEEYGIDLDKNLTLGGMVEQLETEFGE